MTKPLQPGDPRALGPFAVDSRLADSPAGVVYLGADEDGRRAAIAALVGPAAADPAMQARFRAAADPGELYAGDGGVRVLAADLDAATPWVATSYDGIRPSAERVIEELSVAGPTARYFQPFTQYPQHPGYIPQTGSPGAARRAWWWWVVIGIILLALVLLLLVVLSRCGGSGPQPQPSGSSSSSQSGSPSPTPSQSSSTSRSPSQSNSPSPSRTQTRTPTETRRPTQTGGTGTGQPTGPPLDLTGAARDR